MLKYEMTMCWSEEDRAYLADAPELPGCMAHGESGGAALAHVQDAIQLWIDTAFEFGDVIPELDPESRGRRLPYA